MKKFLPLIGVEVYLVATLLILYFGPVDFRLHNQWMFLVLMCLYHSFFILGYWISIKTVRPSHRKFNIQFSTSFFYISLLFGTLSAIGAYNNLMLSDSFIPYGFFDNLVRGLVEPGLVYTERMMLHEAGASSGSRVFNIFSFLFSFFKLLVIFQFVYFWNELDKFKKILSIIYSAFFLSAGVASGTNSVVFIFFIFLTLSILVVLYVNNYKYMRRLILLMAFLFLVPVGSFGNIVSQRGGGFEYFAATSPLGDIAGPSVSVDLDHASLVDFFYYSFVWLNYYLVQGYYGFSLILDMDHNWTFGFGNSAFLQRQLLVLTGVDVIPLTFQNRISPLWDESVQWHSFYGQFANDFGLVGLVVFMFVLGFFLAKTWASIIYNGSLYGLALMPIYIIMFVFVPANNQIFGYIDTFSYFVFVNIFWVMEGKRMRAIQNV